ncbi:hypothetical protein [Paenibacillus ferrarius]|uniref:hypothetical protein n=1 Tax=Paenibacillus ferrarius TaxID=1469647 RepID=UPI00117D3AE0|nr:hypothetical protein [Paenibacillus ferrarius]
MSLPFWQSRLTKAGMQPALVVEPAFSAGSERVGCFFAFEPAILAGSKRVRRFFAFEAASDFSEAAMFPDGVS